MLFCSWSLLYKYIAVPDHHPFYPQKKMEAEKKLDLWTVPELLEIHLKRFSYGDRGHKICTKVDFPLVGLDLKEYLKGPLTKTDALYDLCAVSNHVGSSFGRGHHHACVKMPDDTDR